MLQGKKQGHHEMKGIIDKLKQYEGRICDSRGASRGIATLWNHSVSKHITDRISQYWIKVTREPNR